MLSIIGANAVVLTNVPPLSVVAGLPGKVVRRITIDNCLSYRASFPALGKMAPQDFVELVRQTAAAAS
jgi:serine acetyltransferase